MSALPLASARLIKLRILCLNDVLDGDLCKIFFISIFSLFSRFHFKHDFITSIDFTRSEVQTQQVMTSLIRSHTEYLTQTCHMLVLIL